MKVSIILLCVVVAIIAFVDASAIERRRIGDLRERGKEQPCTKTSRIRHGHKADSGKANNGQGRKGGKGGSTNTGTNSTSTATAAAVTNKGTTNRKGTKKNGGAGTTSTTSTSTDTSTGTDTSASTATLDSSSNQNTGNGNGNNNNGGSQTTDAASNTCLVASALQTGSEQTGQNGTVEAGQVASQTSDNNFINVCAGQVLTNGLQITTGSCNGIPLGFIPAKQNMPSSMITFPANNQDLTENTSFQIVVNTIGMNLGHFTNAKLTYYSAPTFLDNNGIIIGHTHVTVQDLGGSFNPTAPLDPTVFSFFLGINTPPDAQNQVFANVTGGLPAGFYRVCTMVANSNHSPLQMPVAQRGAQDDCKYFSVGQGSNNNNNNNQNSNANTNTDSSSTSTTATDTSTSTSTAATTTTTTATTNKGGKGGRKGTQGTNKGTTRGRGRNGGK